MSVASFWEKQIRTHVLLAIIKSILVYIYTHLHTIYILHWTHRLHTHNQPIHVRMHAYIHAWKHTPLTHTQTYLSHHLSAVWIWPNSLTLPNTVSKVRNGLIIRPCAQCAWKHKNLMEEYLPSFCICSARDPQSCGLEEVSCESLVALLIKNNKYWCQTTLSILVRAGLVRGRTDTNDLLKMDDESLNIGSSALQNTVHRLHMLTHDFFSSSVSSKWRRRVVVN